MRSVGTGGAVGLAEPGPEDSAFVTVSDLPGEFPGERAAAGAGLARDEEDPGAGRLAAGDGVQARALDVGAQLLQLSCAAQELALGRSVL